MFEIPKQYKSLKFIKPIQWSEIFDTWRKGEAHQDMWKKHWKERGFDSWDEWREAYAAPLNPNTLSWELFEIKNPVEDMPLIYGVSTRSWVDKMYDGKPTMQLCDLVKLPRILENEKVNAVKENFPKETMLTGLVHGDNIYLIEGMHRACALAGWDINKELNSEVKIALAMWDKDIPIIGGNYKK